MNILLRSDHLLVYPVTESRRISNFFWAFIVFLGSLGLLLVAISCYIGMDFCFFYKEILDFPFIPQGAIMSFYGMAGLFISFYLWCIILWDVGGGYDIFDKKKRKVCFLRWGFPGKNRRIIFEVPLEKIVSIKILIGIRKGGIFTRTLIYESIVYMETVEQGFIPLTRIEDNLGELDIANRAAELSIFLDVPLLY